MSAVDECADHRLLDGPTAKFDRHYALPLQGRKDCFRLYAAEAQALGMRFAVPLATTTDESSNHSSPRLGLNRRV